MPIRRYPGTAPTPGGGGFPDYSAGSIRWAIPTAGLTTMPYSDFAWSYTTVAASALNPLLRARSFPSLSISGVSSLRGFVQTTSIYLLGASADIGGFIVEFFVGTVNGSSAALRFLSGLAAAGALANLNVNQPSVYLRSIAAGIALGADQTDTNLQIIHGSGLGTVTKIDLGANFPKVPSTEPGLIRVRFTALSNSPTVDYEVENYISGGQASGTISTTMPSVNLYLGFQFCGYSSSGNYEALFHRLLTQSPPP